MKYPRWLILLPLLGCSLPAPTPPSAEFLLADAGSTYWVRSGPRGISARTSPLILTKANDRFYEVYVGEVTRSYEDALFTREPIYSRDVLNGSEKLLWEERKVTDWEKTYLQQNPGARMLAPDDEGGDVLISATAESDILAVVGPYILYDRRVTLERENFQRSDSSRSALDIRTGSTVPLESLVRDSSVLGAGATKEKNDIRWRHSGFDVIARWDDERAESQVVIRDLRGREWPLGYVTARLPRIFWLDEPRMDSRLRTALSEAFDEARADDIDTQLVLGPALRRVASVIQ